MRLLDLFKQEDTPETPLLEDLNKDTLAVEGLTESSKAYMNEVGAVLGYGNNSIKTLADWEALENQESQRLRMEEENNLMSIAVNDGLNGNGPERLQNAAGNLVRTIKLPEVRIPSAAAISAARQELAESDADNPENSQAPSDWTREQQTIYENRAIILDQSVKAEQAASDAPWSDLGKELLGNAPGWEAKRASSALNALGLSSGDIIGKDVFETMQSLIEKTNAATYYKAFAYMLNHAATTRSTGEMVQIVRAINDKWKDADVNPYVIAEFWKQAKEYQPGAATLNAALLLPTAKAVLLPAQAAAQAASVGLYKAAAKNVAKASLESASIPFADTIVETTFKKVNRLVKAPTELSQIEKTLDKAIKTKNRTLIRDITEELIGVPTEDKTVFRAENKGGVVRYFIDDVAMPTTSPEKSLANTPETIANKIRASYAQKLNAIIAQASEFEDVRKNALDQLWTDINGRLDINNLVGAGRGTYGEKIVGYSDSVLTKEGSQVFLVKLVDDEKPMSKLLSRIVDGKDEGFLEAEKIGKQLTQAAQVSNTGADPVGLAYRVEKRNGYWIPTLEIDTKKGIGQILYDNLWKEGKIKQESWRPFASSWATWTSNPTDIQMATIMKENSASLFRNTGDGAAELFKGLNKAERAEVQALWDISTKYGAFYEPEHLLLRGYSEAQVNTYMAGKLMNDFSYFVQNRVERADLISKGGKKVFFNDKEIEGVVRPVRDYHSGSELLAKTEGRKVLIDAIEGTPVTLEADQATDLFKKGYILIEPSISPDATIAARSFYYLLNPSSTVINDLGEFVMTYVPGGRRFFDRRSTFLKQLLMKDREEGRGVSIVGVQTFFADLDEAGMVERAKWLNRVRDAWIDNNIELTNSIIGEKAISKAPFTDYNSFGEWAEMVGIDMLHKENRIEAVKGNQILSSYNSYLKSKDVEDLVGMENMKSFARNAHFQAITNEAKVQRARRTGRELYTWDFDEAQPVDFEMQMRYLVNDMVENDVLGPYTDIYADRFAKEFKDVLATRRGEAYTPRELLFDVPFIKGTKGAQAKQVQAGETARANYKFMRGTPSELDTKVATTGRSVLEYVGAKLHKLVPEAMENAVHKVRVDWEKLQSYPLLHYQRALAAHWYLGMFNTAQFWKQSAQDISIAMMDMSAPKFAGDAMRIMPVILKSNGSKEAAIRLAKEAFENDPKMLNNALNIIDMGLFEHGTAGGFLERGQTTSSKVARLSFLPFNWGEMHPRVLSGLTALNREGLYNVRANATQLRGPTLYAKSLYMNMDSIGMSRMQNSQISQTLLQFMNPRLRWLETVLFDANLTEAQRARLFFGTIMLTGTEGTFGTTASAWVGTNIYRMFHNENEEELPAIRDRQNIWTEMLRLGIPNAVSERTGVGINFVSPLEPGLFDIFSVVKDAADLDIVSTQVLAKFGRFLQAPVVYTYRKLMGQATAGEFEQALDRMILNAPSAFRPVLGYNIYRTGEILNARGELVERTNSKVKAVLLGLGFENLTYKQLAKHYADYSNHTTYVKAMEDEAYDIMLDIVKYGGLEKDTTAYETLFKTANLSDLDKAHIHKRVCDRAIEAVGIEKVRKALVSEYIQGGTGSTTFIVLDKGE